MSTDFPSRLQFVGEARVGRTVEARWIVRHPMESGLRVNDSGQRIPRNIIEQVWVRVNGELVLAFSLTVPSSAAVVVVEWRDDRGQTGRVQQLLQPLD